MKQNSIFDLMKQEMGKTMFRSMQKMGRLWKLVGSGSSKEEIPRAQKIGEVGIGGNMGMLGSLSSHKMRIGEE